MEDQRAARIEAKIDKVIDHISSIDVTMAKQQVSLDIHIKRSELLEAQVSPIQERMSELRGAIRFIKLLGVIAAIAEAARLYIK